MKTKIKHYWIIITLVILVNVFVFKFFSNKLDTLIAGYSNEYESRNGL